MDIEKIANMARTKLPPEARGAGAGSSPEKEKTKEEDKKAKEPIQPNPEELKAKELEAQAKKDEELLSKKDEDLNAEEKTRKTSLLKIKEDAKEGEQKSNIQKRIDELTGKIKDLEYDRNVTKQERDTFRTELEALKKQLSMTPQVKDKEDVKKEMLKRRSTYLEEDKVLPKEERREMSREELDEWALEDYEAAQDWIARRSLRRIEEERQYKQDQEMTAKAEVILTKQQESAKKTYLKHPELNITKRVEALKEQGKSPEEIRDIIVSENPKYRLMLEIYQENPDKFILAENGPELIAEEMEKRLGSSAPKGSDTEVELLKKKVEELLSENTKLKGLDVGITNTHSGEPPEVLSDIEKKQAVIAQRVGLDPKRLKDRVKERKAKGYDD